ncbi:uncharacterized protein LOC106698442 [Myotis lucifugus]|uniref:uncharacterized protein LOC106698442 n=1 Tax=Myotis lucifugus TaxID=59463 RepID=UPI0006D7312E|nr:uncharacterized protein LOC106698442 [Myotis lucifugus]
MQSNNTSQAAPPSPGGKPGLHSPLPGELPAAAVRGCSDASRGTAVLSAQRPGAQSASLGRNRVSAEPLAGKLRGKPDALPAPVAPVLPAPGRILRVCPPSGGLLPVCASPEAAPRRTLAWPRGCPGDTAQSLISRSFPRPHLPRPLFQRPPERLRGQGLLHLRPLLAPTLPLSQPPRSQRNWMKMVFGHGSNTEGNRGRNTSPGYPHGQPKPSCHRQSQPAPLLITSENMKVKGARPVWLSG